MYKKTFSIITAILLGLLFSTSYSFAADNFINQQGSNQIDMNGTNNLTLSASTDVYMSARVDSTSGTTSGIVAAVHSKGRYAYGMDSDGGPMYRHGVTIGQTSGIPNFPASKVTGTDAFAGGSSTTWTTF